MENIPPETISVFKYPGCRHHSAFGCQLKYNRWTRRHIPGAPKTMKLTGNTSEMLRHYVGNRKKGHIFINGRTGKRLTLRHFEKMIDKWARLLNIQRRQSIKPSGREYHLITLMGLREAGERHHDLQWR
ncbi:MAG: hypothetical protein IBX40_10480 [Methanosarcinales archaeon]|nr:hypothetical protein [Methanosarcinales archaeon]